MLNCLACSSSFRLNAQRGNLCPICLEKVLQEKAHCQECNAVLNFSSPYCQQCRHRHGMANCHLCQYELFKHAAISITRQSILPVDAEAPFLTRCWQRLRPSQITQTHYFHRYCAQMSPEVLSCAKTIRHPNLPSPEFEVDSVGLNDRRSQSSASQTVFSTPLAPRDDAVAENEIAMTQSVFPLLGINAQDLAQTPLTFEDESQPHRINDSRLSPQSELDGVKQIALINDYQSGRRDFMGLDYPESEHADVNLSGIDLRDANLAGAIWARVSLAQANLSSINLDQANLREINFKGALFREANLRQAQVFLSDFGYTDLSGANLEGSDFYASYFHRAYLTGANLSRTRLDATDFSWAYLAQANLENASLIEAILEGVTFENTCLVASNLTWANLQDSCFLGANLKRANFQHSILTGADFSGAQLSNADFSKTNLGAAHSFCQAQYSEGTQFPPDFNPDEREMIKIE